MNAFRERLQRGPMLWLDYSAYAAALLAGGEPPWQDLSAWLAWQRKAQGLLKSDVLSLDLGRASAAWLATHPQLREALAAKRRAVLPLKQLLADEALRAQLLELARGLRASFAQTPMALHCPSPKLWLRQAYAEAHGAEAQVEIGEDEIDSASLYLADFLRGFGDAGFDALLLVEDADSEPESETALALYQSVLNVAAHYRWSALLLAPGGRYAGGAIDGIDGVIAPQAARSGIAATLLPASYWREDTPPVPVAAALRYSEIPAGAQPEAVLQRLAALRA